MALAKNERQKFAADLAYMITFAGHLPEPLYAEIESFDPATKSVQLKFKSGFTGNEEPNSISALALRDWLIATGRKHKNGKFS